MGQAPSSLTCQSLPLSSQAHIALPVSQFFGLSPGVDHVRVRLHIISVFPGHGRVSYELGHVLYLLDSAHCPLLAPSTGLQCSRFSNPGDRLSKVR